MKILVTGAAGFVPSHLVDLLLSQGHEVFGVDSFITGNRENIEHLKDNPSFHFTKINIIDGVPYSTKFDRIYHMASPASPIDYVELPFETLDAGSKATEVCLNCCEHNGARFLFASTSEVYGDPTVHPQVESYWGNVNPIGPRSVYDEAKRFGEALTMAYQRYRNVDTRIVRIFNTYGPRMRPNDGRVMPAFINQAIRGEPLTVFGDGKQTRSFCYVEDLVRGINALMESCVNTPCNIGNPHEMTMLQLAEYINKFTNNQTGIVYKPLPQDDPTQRKPNIDLARGSLNWEPRVSFEEGVAKTVEWFRNKSTL
jgi:dTDP-glucose 4,6-dehydratase